MFSYVQFADNYNWHLINEVFFYLIVVLLSGGICLAAAYVLSKVTSSILTVGSLLLLN